MTDTLNIESLAPLLELARAEDLGSGDITSASAIPAGVGAVGDFTTKAAGVVCGLVLLEPLAAVYSDKLKLGPVAEDGTAVEPGDVVATVAGPARDVLAYERVALNFLQRLSGIATLTARFVAAVEGTGAAILDTRKTTPGWRELEKFAVRCGGGTNHRSGLHDAVLIKDNHLALGGEDDLPGLARRLREANPDVTVQIEVDTLEQLRRLLDGAGDAVDIVLLDNMPPDTLREAVQIRDELSRRPESPAAGRPLLEASGGVTLDTVRAIAEAGVDRISIGALTHSAAALDLGLEIRTD